MIYLVLLTLPAEMNYLQEAKEVFPQEGMIQNLNHRDLDILLTEI